jgi:HD-GYP domain-containing protein (c-di-GMP phosphodiesterase class II)
MRVPLRAHALIGATASFGAAALLFGVLSQPLPSLRALALLGAAVVLAELFQVPSDESSLDPLDAHTFSFSSGVHISAILLYGPWVGALVAAFGVLAVDGVREPRRSKVAFNCGAFALAAVAGGYAFELAGGVPGALALPADFAPLAALAIAYSTVNTGLVTSIISLIFATPWRSTLADGLRSAVPSTPAEAALGVLLAVCAVQEPWAIAAVVPLVVAAYFAHARLALLRRETARALETFANVVDERDSYTYRHSARVAESVRVLGERLGFSPSAVSRLYWAGRLHDLGKIATDASVLRKPDQLSDTEWAAIRRHPRLSARLLQRFHLAAGEARAVEYHHERFDGNGYYGIEGRHVPIAAHFLIVADTYDAMRSDRPYRSALSREEALAVLEANSGTQFHPAVAKAFVALERGEDPAAALSAEERAELGRLRSKTPAVGRRRLGVSVSVGSDALTIGAGAFGLVAFGIGVPALGLVGLTLAGANALVRRYDAFRARRLAGSLRSVLASPAPAATLFNEIASRLSYASDLRWAGLVHWEERHLRGRVELQWGSRAETPSETALTSWLIREVESSGPLVASEADLGRSGVHLAVPLSSGDAVTGYLVFAFARSLARPAQLALRSVATDLGAALAPSRPTDEPTAGSRPLAAVS